MEEDQQALSKAHRSCTSKTSSENQELTADYRLSTASGKSWRRWSECAGDLRLVSTQLRREAGV